MKHSKRLGLFMLLVGFVAAPYVSQVHAWPPIDGGRMREIWIAPDPVAGNSGAGTPADPFLVTSSADFDSLMSQALAAGIKTFHLAPGAYLTKGYINGTTGSGWKLTSGTRLKGTGPQSTTILRDRAILAAPNGNLPAQMILGEGDYIEISDLTIDCNAEGSDSSSIGAITILGNHAFVQRVVASRASGQNVSGVDQHAHVFHFNGDGGRSANVVDQCLVRDVVVPTQSGAALSLSAFSGTGAVTFRECRAYLPAGLGFGFNTQGSSYHLVERCFVEGGAGTIAGAPGNYQNIVTLGPPPADLPPTISIIANLQIPLNSNTGPVAFTVGDDLTAPSALTLTRGSDNLSLVPLAGIVFGGAGANRTVTVTPALNQVGTANITITVGDGVNQTSTSFQLTVVQPPTGGAIFDDFNRANAGSLGANWTTVAGTFAIVGQTARGELPSYGKNAAIWTAAETPTVNQYVRIKFNPNGWNGFVGMIFRYSDASSGHYVLDFNYQSCYWSYYTDLASSSQRNIINGSTYPSWPILSNGSVVAMTITGTGAATRLRIWFNVTASAPTAADLWDGQAPAISTLISAGPTADSGRKMGIITFQNQPFCTIDDFQAGSF